MSYVLACTQCTFSTLPGVIVPGTGSQPSYTASSEQAPIHFTEVTVLNPSDLLGKEKTCFLQKRYVRVID
jgi:hypothetical protein